MYLNNVHNMINEHDIFMTFMYLFIFMTFMYLFMNCLRYLRGNLHTQPILQHGGSTKDDHRTVALTLRHRRY
jgi:hypothetical protein